MKKNAAFFNYSTLQVNRSRFCLDTDKGVRAKYTYTLSSELNENSFLGRSKIKRKLFLKPESKIATDYIIVKQKHLSSVKIELYK